MWKLLPAVLFLVSCATHASTETATEAAGTEDHRIVSVVDMPLNPSATPPAGQAMAKEFQRRDTRGWIGQTGTWNITTAVTHTRIRCATYETGIQLGAGDPACSDVRWLTDVEFGTRETHCNSATRIHTGGGEFADGRSIFGASNCVRVVTRCAGPC